MPKVSVIIPTHERPMFLIRALRSVRAQTFTDYEIIIISNGESYQDRAINRSTAQFYGAIFIELDKGNVSLARNAGIEAAKGEWIAFLDDDDEWLPDKLRRQIVEVTRTKADMIVCNNYEIINNETKKPAKDEYPYDWPPIKAICYQKWIALPSNVLVSKDALNLTQGFDTKQIVNEDCELWRRIAWRHSIHRMPDVLTKRYIGHDSLSDNNRRTYIYELRHHIKMYFDTPKDLRWAIPPFSILIIRPLMKLITPYFIRQPRKTLLSLFKDNLK